MRLSAFNLYVRDWPNSGEVLVHNTFSGAYAVLDSATLEVLEKNDRGEPLTLEEQEIVRDPRISEPDVGIVVESLEGEEQQYRRWFDWRRSGSSLDSIVGINLACNFDCPYCCQAEFMDGSVMRPDVADRTADWLAGRAIEVDVDSAHIVFVGGEPLLHAGRIKSIAARLRARLDAHGIHLSLGLITNGYFLTGEMVRELVPYGLTVAQVTLDGDETTHSLTRVSKKGEDTFARILGNVVAASRHIRVNINGNYQENTVAGFGPLIEKLASARLATSSKMSFTPALEILGAPSGSGSGSCTFGGSAYQHRIALYDEIVRHGYAAADLHTLGPCGFHSRHMYAIDHLGNIFKCPGFLGHPEWRIGHVRGGLNDRYEQLLAVGTDGRCGDCAHRPNCAGGCVADEFLRTGNHDGVNCELEYLEAVKPHALARGFLMATSDDREDAVNRFPAPPAPLPGRVAETRGVRPAALRVL